MPGIVKFLIRVALVVILFIAYGAGAGFIGIVLMVQINNDKGKRIW